MGYLSDPGAFHALGGNEIKIENILPCRKKDVLAVLHPGQPEAADGSTSLGIRQRNAAAASGGGGMLPAVFGGGSDIGAFRGGGDSVGGPPPAAPNDVACLVAAVCIVALFLPTDTTSAAGQQQSSHLLEDFPWLHVSVHLKLVFAYVLGLVTLAVLRV